MPLVLMRWKSSNLNKFTSIWFFRLIDQSKTNLTLFVNFIFSVFNFSKYFHESLLLLSRLLMSMAQRACLFTSLSPCHYMPLRLGFQNNPEQQAQISFHQSTIFPFSNLCLHKHSFRIRWLVAKLLQTQFQLALNFKFLQLKLQVKW